MEAAEKANLIIASKYSKERKVGEGTYAVVYLGKILLHFTLLGTSQLIIVITSLGKEIATGRKIAIKKVSYNFVCLFTFFL